MHATAERAERETLPDTEPRRTDRREPKRPRRIAALLLGVGPALLWTTLPGNAAPADLALLPIVAIGMLIYSSTDVAQAQFRRRLLLPGALIAIGSSLAMLDLGFPTWGVSTLFSDLVTTLTFLGTLSYARRRSLSLRTYGTVAVAMATVTAVILIAQGGYRPQATLSQPNYAANFVVTCMIVGLPHVRRRWWFALPVLLGGVFTTASFGALMTLPIALGYRMFGIMRKRMRTVPGPTVFLAWLLLLLPPMLAAGGLFGAWTARQANFEGLDNDRFEGSGTGRKYLWEGALEAYRDDPLGIGPGGYKALQIRFNLSAPDKAHEVHHDFLGYLVERGPVAVIGLILLYSVLWRAGRPGGTVRSLLLMNLVAGLFRETLHYRHVWVALGVALAAELSIRTEEPPVTNDSEETTPTRRIGRSNRQARLAKPEERLAVAGATRFR